MATELIVKSLVAGYAGTTIIDDIHLAVREGERVGIIGRNGAGKTTTLASIMGLTQQLSGQVLFDGQDLSHKPAWQRARAGIGYIPQTRDIFPSLTVEENLIAGLKGAPLSRIDEAYAMFARLGERRSNYGNELSGGEQQMLSIARVMMGQPRILLLDEPLEGLSPLVAKEVMQGVEALAQSRGLGCVLVEQQVALVLDFSTRILVLERGRSVFWGETQQLRNRPEILESAVALAKTKAADAAVTG